MYKKTIFPLIALAALAIGVSVVYFPSREERAVMKLKDKEFEEAAEDLEQIYDEGSLSPTVVRSLTQLYIQEGKVDKAINLLEKYIGENPSDLDARRLVGKYYQYAQRTEDYVANLEILNRLEMTKNTLEELSAAYNFHGDVERQATVLEEMVNRADSEPKHFVSLAYLYAQTGKVDKALATLKNYAEKDLIGFKGDILEFYVILLLDQDKGDIAFNAAKTWLDANFDVEVAERIINHFQNKDDQKRAYKLLKVYKNRLRDNPRMQFLYATLQYQNGFKGKAYRRLKFLSDNGKISPDFFPYFASIVLDFGELSLLKGKMNKNNIQNLSDKTMIRFAEVAVKSDEAFLEEVLEKVDFESLRGRPLFATNLFLTAGKKDQAISWLDKALVPKDETIDYDLKLLDVLMRAKIPDVAIARLPAVQKKMSEHDELIDFADYVRLAKIYMELKDFENGEDFFANLLAQNKKEVLPAYMLLKTAAGDEQTPLSWVKKEKTFHQYSSYLADLINEAKKKSFHPLALAASRRLYETEPTTYARQLYAGALMMSGKPKEAIPLIEALPYLTPEAAAYLLTAYKATKNPKFDKTLKEIKRSFAKREATYQQGFVYTLINVDGADIARPFMKDLVLKGDNRWIYTLVEQSKLAGKTGGIVELLENIIQREQDIDRKEGYTYALLDIVEEKEALPYVKKMAEIKGGNWNYAYLESLEKVGDVDTYKTFVKTWAMKPETPVKEVKGLGFDLLEKGFKDDALGIFKHTFDLKLDKKSRKDMLNQLLNLWGPHHHDKKSVGWVLEKLNDARKSGNKKAAGEWMNLLVESGSGDKVVSMFKRAGNSAKVPENFIIPYFKALAQQGDKRTIKSVFDKTIAGMRSVPVLHELGELAQFQKFSKILTVQDRRKIYERIHRLNEKEPKAIQQLAYIAYTQNEFELAGQHFRRFFELSKGDYVANYFYGEVLRLQQNLEAETYYKNAMRMIHEAKQKDTDMLLVRAQIMSHQGYSGRSLKLLKDLHYYLPGNTGIRADLAQFLLENDKQMEAREILRF